MDITNEVSSKKINQKVCNCLTIKVTISCQIKKRYKPEDM